MSNRQKRPQPRCRVILCLLTIGCHLAGCSSTGEPKKDTTDSSIVRKAEKSGVSMLVEVSPSRPKLSELVSMKITVSFPDSVQVEPPEFGQSVGDFAIRDYSQQSLSSTSDESNSPRSEIAIRYQLEPMFSGRNLIRSLPVAFSTKSPVVNSNVATGKDSSKRDVLQSEPIEIFIESEFGDQPPDLSHVSPMIEPIDSRSNSRQWLWIGLVGALLLALLGYGLAKSRKGKLPEVQVSPEEIAESALNQLIAEQLPAKGLVKEFYLRLTGIVRAYIESKTGLRAPEQTTEEFLRDMRSSRYFDATRSNQLHEFLSAADLVKYAGQQPDRTNIAHSVERAREFIALQFAEIREADDLSRGLAGVQSLQLEHHRPENFSQVGR